MNIRTDREHSRRPRLIAGLAGVALAAVTVLSLTGAAVAKPADTAVDRSSTVAAAQANDIGAQAVPGNWTLAYDWGCDGSYSTTAWTFNSNGTWTGQGYTGPWVQVGSMLMFTFDGSETTYSANVQGMSMTGIQTTFSGLNGCFYMLQAGAPTVASNGESLNAAGKG